MTPSLPSGISFPIIPSLNLSQAGAGKHLHGHTPPVRLSREALRGLRGVEGFRVLGFRGAGFRGFWVQELGFRVQGLGFAEFGEGLQGSGLGLLDSQPTNPLKPPGP